MAGQDGPQTDSLMKRLHEHPHQFDFFQLVRRLECARAASRPVGQTVKPSEDPIRFGQRAELRFAPSPIQEFLPADETHPARLFVSFFGLLGPNGPLPLHITQYVRERTRFHNDHTLEDFLNLFHHRMASLFYRAWAIHQMTVNYERPGGGDKFALYIASLCGYGMDSLRNRDAVPDAAKLHYSGRLSNLTRNAEGLESVIGDFFRITTKIEQFVGQWLELPVQYRLKMGDSPSTGLLGKTAIVGSKIWDCQQKFRIRLGPMNLEDYRRMLPSGSSFRRMADWVRNYVGDQLSWDVRLVLAQEEVPKTRLGGSDPAKGSRLGWTTWIKSAPSDRDADQLVLNPAPYLKTPMQGASHG